jgi:ribosomal protein S18 acetylase RimI-like enzyme
MTGKVIQGFFLGGQPKLTAVQPRIAAPPPIQAKPAARPPATSFAGRPPGPPIPAFGARPPGPPAPAFAPRPEAVQRHGAGNAFSVDSGALGLASCGGRPLPEAVRGQMEAALGADFSNVRVHVGPQAERISAIAFTVGSDIYFAPGRYQPDTVHGQQLLGHELAHVVQQRAGRVRNPLGSGLAVVQDHALEAEADRLGQRAAMHRVAAQAKFAPGAAQPSAPVRISPPVSAGLHSYRLSAGAGGREVGSVMVHARDRGAVEVTDLGVDAAQRGNGVGQMLVAAAARAGQRFGKSKVTLASQDSGSGHLTRWYKGMGFTQVGVDRRGFSQLEAPIGRVLLGAAQPKLPGFSARPGKQAAQLFARSSILQRAVAALPDRTDAELLELIDMSAEQLTREYLNAAEKRRLGLLKVARDQRVAKEKRVSDALDSRRTGTNFVDWEYYGDTYHINLSTATSHVTKEVTPREHYFFEETGMDIKDKQPTTQEKGTHGKKVFSALPEEIQEFIKVNWDDLLK